MASLGIARASAFTFLCFLVVGLLLTRPNLNSPFFWDDLHLVRVYSPEQLVSVWTGTWDTDHIETPGFRPLTAYFNHLRALAFGESVADHRAFLVVLFALYLTMAGFLARQFFVASFWQVLLAGLLTLFHIASVYHYFWISDGVHLLSGILVMGALISFLKCLSSGHWAWLLASLSCIALALLTREDALIIYPLLLWFAGAHLWLQDRSLGANALPKAALVGFAAAALIVLGAYWYVRAAAIHNAAQLRIDLGALLWGITQTIQNAGSRQTLAVAWPRFELIISSWEVWLCILLIVSLVSLKRGSRVIVLIWSGAVIIAALPVMLAPRANVLLLPVTFWGLLVAHVLAQFWRQSPAVARRVFASGMIFFALVVPAYASLAFQQEMRPNNLAMMCRNATLLYGLSGPVTIPPARRVSVQEQLTTFGISDLANFKADWPIMERKALAGTHFGVNSQDLPFIPLFQFLPQFQLQPRCEPPK